MIETARVTKMLRLMNRLHRMPRDPALRKRELLDGMSAMVSADGGACAVLHVNGDPSPRVLSATMSRRPGRRPTTESTDALMARITAAVHRASRRRRDPWTHADDSEITTVVRIGRHDTFGGLTLTRRRGQRGFDRHDHLIVDAFHSEVSWVYELDLPLASPQVVQLAPRARETLQFLLAGMSEKEVADRLKLSPNTVHHYVKQLYRHFDVSSRSELLAQWVRKDPPPRRH